MSVFETLNNVAAEFMPYLCQFNQVKAFSSMG